MVQSNPATAYDRPREIYRQLRAGLANTPAVLDEFLRALGLLISEYDTSIRENRFLVGGVTEIILAATMRCVGIENAQARGLELDGEDIVVGGCRISVKASFTGRRDAIRLINALGDADQRAWQTPTIFVLAARGIGYADPVLLPGAVRSSRDALVLSRKPLDDLHDAQPRWFLRCEVPAKPQNPPRRRTASEDVAPAILNRQNDAGHSMFPNLSGAL